MRDPRSWFQHAKRELPRIAPPCPVAECGGCLLQDLDYPRQLELKRAWVAAALAEAGVDLPFSVTGLEEQWRYRNRAEFSFNVRDGAFVLGYHAAGSFSRVVPIEDCLLVPEPADALLRRVRDDAAQSGLAPYHASRNAGVLRSLLVRATPEGALAAALVTTGEGEDFAKALAEGLRAEFPALQCFLWIRHEGKSDRYGSEDLRWCAGDPLLKTRIGGYRIGFHALSFLQASTAQADRMYRYAVEGLPADAQGAAWDVYCGLGVIGLYLSARYRKVYGIEAEGAMLDLARENARENGCGNLEFHAGPAEDIFMDRRFWLREAAPSAVVLDPPRAGAQPSVLAAVLGARPKAIAYISCNAQSLARDLKLLLGSYPRYRVRDVRAFDMFPQTHHLETVALLERGV